MEQIRKGNDIKVYWEIITGGDGSEIPYELEGKALELYVQNAYEKVRISDFVANGNVIEWTFYGKDQKTAGVYSLTLIENNGSEGMRTVDECNAFELVTHSCKAGGNAESRVSIETVRLRSVMTLSDVVPDKELNKNSTNVVENGAIAREFEKKNGEIAKKQDIIPDLVKIREGASKGATALQAHQDISGKADTSGRYPEMSVGFADDLVGRGESVPAEFSFRASGGKSIKDGSARIKRLKGNSVVWNNLYGGGFYAQQSSISENGNLITVTPSGEFPGIKNDDFSFIVEHKYICIVYRLDGGAMYINAAGNYDSLTNVPFTVTKASRKDVTIYTFGDLAGSRYVITRPRIIDLTLMFGAGNEPTTIEEYEARKPIVEDEYAYNEGEVIHMTAEGVKSVGDNALNADRSLVFDFGGSYGNYDFINTEDAFVGISADGYINKEAIDYAEKIEGGFRLRNTGGGYGIGLFVKALPNEEYSVSYASDNGRITFGFYDKGKNLISYGLWGNRFTTPSNCEYIMLCLRDNEVINIDISFTDIMLTLVHSGWKQDTDAGYQPYWEDTLPLPIIRKYFPDGMKSAGSAHDEIRYNKASGKWEYSKGKIKSVDLGSLNWEKEWYNEADNWRIYAEFRQKAIGLSNMINCIYPNANTGDGVMADKTITGHNNPDLPYIYLRDTYYSAEGADALIASLQGVMLYYESNDWEWVELDAEDQNFNLDYKVADFGTEEIIASQPSTPISADIIYQFNAVDMIREHELEITELQRIIATMQAQLTSLTSNNGGQ